MALEVAVQKLKRIERDTFLMTLGCAFLFGFVTGSLDKTLGLLLGGGLMLANFHFLWWFAERIFNKETRNKGVFIAGLSGLSFIFLGAVGFCFLILEVPALPFFIGTLPLLASIFLNSIILG